MKRLTHGYLVIGYDEVLKGEFSLGRQETERQVMKLYHQAMASPNFSHYTKTTFRVVKLVEEVLIPAERERSAPVSRPPRRFPSKTNTEI